MKFFVPFLLLIAPLSAQIDALFKTNIAVNVNGQMVSDFTVRLDQHNAPLATANFMLLAGIPDDVWTENRPGDLPAENVVYSPLLPGVPYRKTGRLTLNVVYQAKDPTNPEDVDKYIIRQGQQGGIELARVSALPDTNGVYHDLSGRGLVEIHREPETTNFSIVIKHRRNWLNHNFKTIQEAPMYRNIPVTQVENGRRFFSGTLTDDPDETVGYRFPDEIARSNDTLPWGTNFSDGWVLAMDNQQRNSNGSRFFITGLPLPGDLLLMREWNQRYTAFGLVLTTGGGRNVVNAILNSSSDPDGVPGSNISIQSIEITRESDGDLGFFPHLIQEEMPGQTNPLPLRFENNGGMTELITPQTPGSQQIFISSTDLQSDRLVFFSAIPPNSSEEARLNLTPFLDIQPKAFFEAYWSNIPDWHSKQFDFSGAFLQFNNVNENGIASGGVTMVVTGVSENNLIGTFSMILPAKQVVRPDGSTVNFPIIQEQGTFSATYESDQDPYRGFLQFNASGTSNNFPFTFMNLNFDYHRGTTLQNRISRFTAGSVETDYAITGVWKRTN